MAIVLYMKPLSPPARAVLMTAEALGLELETKMIDLGQQEHLSEEYKQMNPQHTVPTLDDDGTIIWDSHAIIAYLVGKYGKDDSLYPKDYAKRAVVDQRLHFDTGVMFNWARQIVRAMLFKGVKTIPEDYMTEILTGYDFLNKFLNGQKWMAGDSPTIADISLVSTVSSINTFIPVDPEKFPNVCSWMENMEKLPFYFVNKPGLEEFDLFMKSLMA